METKIISLSSTKIKGRKNKKFDIIFMVMQFNSRKNISAWVRYSCWHKTIRKYKIATLLLTAII